MVVRLFDSITIANDSPLALSTNNSQRKWISAALSSFQCFEVKLRGKYSESLNAQFVGEA